MKSWNFEGLLSFDPFRINLQRAFLMSKMTIKITTNFNFIPFVRSGALRHSTYEGVVDKIEC